jgi:hypothetical protein
MMSRLRIHLLLMIILVQLATTWRLKGDSIDDRIIVLMGDRARTGPGIVYTKGDTSAEFGYQAMAPKRRFMEGWDLTNYLEWVLNDPDQNGNIHNVKPGKYHIDMLVEADGSVVTITCERKGRVYSAAKHQFGNSGFNVNPLIHNWTKESVNELIKIPAGPCIVIISKYGGAVKFRSLELVHEKDHAKLRKEIARLRGDASWLYHSSWGRPKELDARYGLKLQWGWNSVQGDGHKKYGSWDEQVRAFNVERFAKNVESTGAEVVMLQVSKSENGGLANSYYYPGICATIDSIVGDQSRTAQRDLIMDMANALAALDHPVRLMFYYHVGHASMTDSPWWPKNWVHQDDKKKLFRNWCRIFRELGDRYQEKLGGIFFDDGMIYYPAPFHERAGAAKRGYRQRLIGYNAYNAGPRLTDFQDFYYGEGQQGIWDKDALFLRDAVGRQTGIFAAGPLKGLQYEGHFRFGTDGWASGAEHYTYKETHSNEKLLEIVTSALQRISCPGTFAFRRRLFSAGSAGANAMAQ